MTDSVQYQAAFPVALAQDAGRRFTGYVYRRMFGWKIAAAALINVVGCVAMVLLSGWVASTIAFCAAIAVVTLYFAVNWLVRPRVTAARLLRTFGNGATVTLRPEGFDLQTSAGKLSRPWGRQRAILEFDDYFLLVILPTIGLVLPRQGMPQQGVDWVRAAMKGPMTRWIFPDK